MEYPEDYIAKNKTAWNQKTMYHLDSDFYALPAFIEGKSSLNEIELSLIGEISGKTILHLQCHFGQDSLSLARMGAKVTGIDFSEAAIEAAKNLALQLALDTTFVLTDVYNVPECITEKFDLVFTTYGTIGWLPDLEKWANVAAKMLKPGGKFLLVDFHPFVWTLDDDFKQVHYHYFNEEAIIEKTTGTYADRNAPIEIETVGFNHSLSEIINNLIQSGLTIDCLNEYPYSPYSCFPNLTEIEPRKFIFTHFGSKIPMVYAIVAHL